MMSKLHPDRHFSKSVEEKAEITRLVSDVTPHSSFMHLLAIVTGISINEKDTGELLSSDFLLSIMKIREKIDIASSDKQLNVLPHASPRITI